jgi:hypothetical protein
MECLKFCIDTASFRKVTRQKNIKKGSPKTGYLLRSNRINSSKHYGLFVVSFLVVSVVIGAFLVVSTTLVLVESTTLVVSVVLVEWVPLQAANEPAIRMAKINLLMFFMLLMSYLND